MEESVLDTAKYLEIELSGTGTLEARGVNQERKKMEINFESWRWQAYKKIHFHSLMN